MLHRYWVKFAGAWPNNPLPLGCGVTAFDRADLEQLLTRDLYPLFGELPIAEIEVDIDVSKLDPGHILPNAGPAAVRGIWFPFFNI